jgi:transposase-like protein
MDRNKQVLLKQAMGQGPTGMALSWQNDVLSEGIRVRVRAAIGEIVNEEFDAVLGAGAYERSGARRGYRNGSRPRTITTSYGKTDFEVPRGVVWEGGKEVEWQSTVIPRYQRRSSQVDGALLGMYFGGVNTRKVKQAIKILFKNAPLSRSTISRIIGKLKAYFEAWKTQSLVSERLPYLYLDGIYVKVRCGGRVGRLPILAVVGIRPNGEKILLALEIRGGEGEEAWKGVLQDLVRRGLKSPKLAMIDGSPGLSSAIELTWPGIEKQRCTVHKLRNLLSHAPESVHEEIRTDFHAIVYADDEVCARAAYDAFVKKWRKLSEGVARSLEEAGLELITFFRYPKSQWKSLRTTNLIERLNQEWRRRIKTQVSFPNESAVLLMLWGLVASGMIRMHRLGGYEDMAQALSERSSDINEGKIAALKATACVTEMRNLEKAKSEARVA